MYIHIILDIRRFLYRPDRCLDCTPSTQSRKRNRVGRRRTQQGGYNTLPVASKTRTENTIPSLLRRENGKPQREGRPSSSSHKKSSLCLAVFPSSSRQKRTDTTGKNIVVASERTTRHNEGNPHRQLSFNT